MEENRDFSQMSSDELWEILPNLTGRDRGFALMSLAHHAWAKHEVDQLLPLAMEAKDLFASLNDKRELAMAYDLIGSAHAHDNKYDDAIVAYEKAFKNVDELSGDAELGLIHRHAADAYRELHKFNEAKEHYYESLNAYLACGDHHAAVHTVDELSMMLTHLGRYDECMVALAHAAQWVIGSVDPLSAMEIQLGLATAHINLGDPDAALEHANIAIGLSKTCTCPRCPIRTQISVAQCLIAAERLDEALQVLEEVETLAASTGKRFYVGQALLMKAQILRRTDPVSAKRFAIEACSIFLVMGRTLAHTFGEQVLAFLKFDEGNFIDAADEFSTLIDDFLSHGRPVVAAKLNIELSRARMALDNPHAALRALDRDDSGFEYLTKRSEIFDFKVARLHALYACKRFDDAKALVIDLIMSVEPSESPETLAIAYEYRARMLINSNPVESDRAAALAMAYFAQAEDLSAVQRVATEFVLERQNSLRAIAEDNDRRALTDLVTENSLSSRPTTIEELVANDAKLTSDGSGDVSESA